jgi:AAA family ATP:ADP antiporter
MLASGLMVAQMVAAKALRDSVFLSSFPATALPTITIAAALFAIGASMIGSRVLRSISLPNLVPSAFLVSAMAQVGERSLYLSNHRIAACVIFLHVFGINLVLGSAFWSLMTEHFDPQSAQKAFGRIAAMGTLGGVLGGLLAERISVWGSIPMLILATATLHLLCGLTLFQFRRGYVAPRRTEPDAEPAIRETLKRSPYLMELVALIISVSIAAGLLDYLFKSQAAQTIGAGPSLTRFFAWFYTATSLFAVVVQAFVTPDVLSRLGLAAAVSSLPLAVAAGGVGVLMVFDLAGLTILRGFEVLLRGSLFRSGYELFFTPVASADKRAVKGIIDVGGERMGDAVGSGLVALFLLVHWNSRISILGAAIAFALVGLALARRLERSYVRALETSLADQSKGMDPGEEESNGMTDSMIMPPGFLSGATAVDSGHTVILQQHPVVQQLLDLRSTDQKRVIHTLAKIETPDPLLCHQLIQLLGRDSFAFLAMDKLRRMATRNAGQLADALLDTEEPFAIRRRLPTILAGSQSQRALDALVEALSDPEFQIRFRSANAIGQLRMECPRMYLNTERIWAVLGVELQVSREVWERRRLMTAEALSDETETPGEASLEYLFALLRLLLPREPVSMAYRALHTDDRHLRGTALEYLQTVLPANTWRALHGLIADRIWKPSA